MILWNGTGRQFAGPSHSPLTRPSESVSAPSRNGGAR